ncbi:hypothetical protein HYS00_05530 [Candidatus Microgenomates bacterium]|nr:hypothetical protein [Candidatus Microgenomates bacterium]
MTDYYDKIIHIPHVDARDNVLGKVERWEAHKKGILHRAITIGLQIDNRYLLQHRKHPVFDKWFDLTASSHPVFYDDGTIQTNEDAVYTTLQREWGIKPQALKGLHSPGHVVYKSKDPNSEYIEHEVCHLFIATVKDIPDWDEELAYGFTMQPAEEVKNIKNPIYPSLASWVKEFIKKDLL